MLEGIIVTKGLAPYRVDLYEDLASHFVDVVEVCVPEAIGHDHPWTKMLDGRSIKIVELPAAQGQGALTRVKALFGFSSDPTAGFSPLLWKHLSKTKPQWILGHETSAYVLTALMWCVVHRVPYFFSSELGKDSPKEIITKSVRLLQSLVELVAKGKIGNTVQALEPFRKQNLPCIFAPHAIRTHQHRITEKLVSRHSSEIRVRGIFVGNLIERKGVDLLIEALACLTVEQQERVLIDFVGRDKDAYYEKMALARGIEKSVHFSGFMEGTDLVMKYQKSDFFILPTRLDTYAVVTHEAATHGLALMISQYAGSAEVLVNEHTGLVFDPLSKESFHQVLSQFIDYPQDVRSMGKQARAFAEKHCVSKSAADVAAWIKKLIK